MRFASVDMITRAARASARAVSSALIAVAAACSGSAADRPAPAKVEVGQPAPAYAAQSLEGDSVSLLAMRDQVVLLNVWATWCHPCRKEIPELQALHDEYGSRGLSVVGVSVDGNGTDDDIRAFMSEYGMTYRIWRDPDERVSSTFRVVGVPATYLIDREGVLRWRMTGALAPGDTSLAHAVERAIAAQ